MKTEYNSQTGSSLIKVLNNEEEIIQIIQTFSDASLIAFYENEMIVDFQNGIKWSCFNSLKHLNQLRIFDGKQELYVFKSNYGFKGRLRCDNSVLGTEVEFFESVPLINGTSFILSKDANHIIVTDTKGTNFTIPHIAPFEKLIGSKRRLAIVTRNYIGYNNNGQAGIIDSRFCEIIIVNPSEI